MKKLERTPNPVPALRTPRPGGPKAALAEKTSRTQGTVTAQCRCLGGEVEGEPRLFCCLVEGYQHERCGPTVPMRRGRVSSYTLNPNAGARCESVDT